jgi:hypothetical protein
VQWNLPVLRRQQYSRIGGTRDRTALSAGDFIVNFSDVEACVDSFPLSIFSVLNGPGFGTRHKDMCVYDLTDGVLSVMAQRVLSERTSINTVGLKCVIAERLSCQRVSSDTNQFISTYAHRKVHISI